MITTRRYQGNPVLAVSIPVKELLPLKALGVEAISNSDSVADEAGAKRMVQAALDHFGRLDIMVNDAGIAVCNYVKQEPGPLYERNREILLEGPMFVVRAAWEQMKKQKFGRILNTSSRRFRFQPTRR